VSQEKILKTLESLGLTQWDAKVYIILAKRGPIKASDAAKALKLSKQRLYPIVKSLQSKGIVNSTLEHPARLSAVPFEKVLDLFVKAKMEQAQRIQRNLDELLSDWQSVAIAESDSPPAKFTVIEGRSYIYSKIQQMIQDTESQLSFVATVPSLARADQFGLFDAAFNHPLKSRIRFRFITEVNEQNAKAVKALLKKKPKTGFNLEGKTPDLGLKLCPRMVIRDEKEMVFFIDPRQGDFASEQDDACLWTNCKSLTHSFLALFEDQWKNSTDIQKKILEIETGKPMPKTYIINDAETAKGKYDATLGKATKEILMVASSTGLIELCKNKRLVTECTKRGVSVKIMAPITGQNLKAAQQLLKFCEVRHVPAGYLETTIVDGQHLFQFKNSEQIFENVFYTSDYDYVEKTRNMLSAMWKSSSVPSSMTLQSILNFPTPSPPQSVSLKKVADLKMLPKMAQIKHIKANPLGAKTPKDVLTKIAEDQKHSTRNSSKDIIRFRGCNGFAIIHPPSHFNLPDMLIYALHADKESQLGAENAVLVHFRLKTGKSFSYVPVVIAGDNPRTSEYWKTMYKGTPAGDNYHLLNSNEIQIQVHGNIFFAGWTVPIPLPVEPYSLPPAAIILEAYGKLKTGSFSYILHSGHKSKNAFNSFDAFVTFITGQLKYTGPGTDGLFVRDVFIEDIPP
jgi:sugar-specific transcriptional regulator TrmB